MAVDRIQDPLERAKEAADGSRRLRDTVRQASEDGRGADSVSRTVLDGLLSCLGLERGFLLILRDGPEVPSGPDTDPFDVIAAREASDRSFADVVNPEFAIDRSVVQKAVRSQRPLAIEDCLVGSDPKREEIHRSVLCRSFRISPGKTAVVYLDDRLGSGRGGEKSVSAFAACLEGCIPFLAQAFLLDEVLELRGRTAGGRGDGGEEVEGPESGAASDQEETLVELPVEIPSLNGIIGASEKMRRLSQVIDKVKDSDLNICIFGESGTGKELVARAIHEASRRREKKFISENCGTIADNLLESELFGHLKGSFTGADEDREGLFQAADGGTLFLDEIGDMSEDMQRKLLRVLQEGMIRPIGSKAPIKVDVRILCASNKNLRALVQAGSFRMDLFYRVNVVSIEVPPLRERLDDLPILAAHFISEMEREEGISRRFSQSAMNELLKYNWPGNVRELRNVLRRSMVTCTRHTIVRKDLLPLLVGGQSTGFSGEDMERTDAHIILRLPRRSTFSEIMDECERVVLLSALKECRWNKSKVVKLLQIPRQSLYNKIEKLGLKRKWQ
jgi:DNA-binding NtrC family response regulator